MARPLTGTSKTTAAGHFLRGVPTARGSRHRVEYSFLSQRPADRWLAEAIAAVQNGRPIPVPRDAELVPATRARRSAGTQFAPLADAWLHRRYVVMRRGNAGRAKAVQGHIAIINAWMQAHDRVMEDMDNDQWLELALDLLYGQDREATMSLPAALDPQAVVTMDQAVALPGMPSESTLKRRQRDGKLPTHHDGERVLYRVADLYRVAARTSKAGRPTLREKGYSPNYLGKIFETLEAVFAYAEERGIPVKNNPQTWELPLLPHEERRAPDRQTASLEQCADIATHLHAVYQLALWLLRILGLRISEAYGISTKDVVDLGPGRPGVVFIAKQGGKRFFSFDAAGHIVTNNHVDWLKNWQSYRKLIVPASLMDLIRVFAAAVHPDHALGDRHDPAPARLIPALKPGAVGGQGGFRSALRAAARKVGLTFSEDETEEVFIPRPHDMRRSIVSDLDWKAVHPTWARRYTGHAAGTDVHARAYILDDPNMRPFLEVAAVIQASIDEELGGMLMIPTSVRCTTGNQEALAPNGDHIDGVLSDAEWLIRPSAGGAATLSAKEFAAMAKVSVEVARRWLSRGEVPIADQSKHVHGAQRRIAVRDAVAFVEKLAARVTIADLAAEYGVGYHRVYEFVRTRELELVRQGGRDVVPPTSEVVIRAHFDELRELESRVVKFSIAAEMLQTTVAVIEHHVAEGALQLGDKLHDHVRTVTRASVEAMRDARRASKAPRPPTAARRERTETVKWTDACTLLGITAQELKTLVATGRLEVEVVDRRRAITQGSLLRHLAQTDPARLMSAIA